MKRTMVFRMYPNKTQDKVLNDTLVTCCHIYNACLEQRIMLYKDRHKRISRIDQQNQITEAAHDDMHLRRVYSQVRLEPTFRVQRAFDGFFRRLNDPTKKAGFPRFKSLGGYDSFTYTQHGHKIISINGKHAKLRLGKIGSINIRYHRPIPEEAIPKTCTIKRKNDKWYAHITYELPDVPVRQDLPEPVGLDMGIFSLYADSNGHLEDNPKHFNKNQAKLRHEQRKAKRMVKHSSNWKKQQKKVAKIHEKTANQRQDNLHKVSRKLVDAYPYLKVEKLQIQNMLLNHKLAKSISDASWGKLFFMLDYKAEEAGGLVEYVDPKGTSQTCLCGNKVPKTLKDRTHVCTKCGIIIDRDTMSAMVIKERDGMSRLACGEGTARAPSMKQEVSFY